MKGKEKLELIGAGLLIGCMISVIFIGILGLVWGNEKVEPKECYFYSDDFKCNLIIEQRWACTEGCYHFDGYSDTYRACLQWCKDAYYIEMSDETYEITFCERRYPGNYVGYIKWNRTGLPDDANITFNLSIKEKKPQYELICHDWYCPYNKNFRMSCNPKVDENGKIVTTSYGRFMDYELVKLEFESIFRNETEHSLPEQIPYYYCGPGTEIIEIN